MPAPGVARAILARMKQTVLRDPAPILADIKTPALLVWGEKDAMIPPSNAADYLRDMPHAGLVRLPSPGSCAFRRRPGRVIGPG